MKICISWVLPTFLPFMAFLQNVKGNIRAEGSSPTQLVRNSDTRRYLSENADVIEGREVQLPCDLTQPKTNERISHIAWYKEMNSIFTYCPPNTWRNVSLPFRHLYFNFTEPATLILGNISQTDEGIYRCSVNYESSSTKNRQISLNVIVPPTSLTILDEKPRELILTAGPYDEGGSMLLKCVVKGGKPAPKIQWLINGKPYTNSKGQQTTLTLFVTKLIRSTLHDEFTCKAFNNNITSPLSKTIRVTLNLPPVDLKMITEGSLSARKKHQITCITYGSKPPAKIIWLINGKEIDSPRFFTNLTVSADGNSSTSVISFTPVRGDNGISLTCKASHKTLQKSFNETVQLDVNYPPKATLILGKMMKAENIEEGQNVIFECLIDANPKSDRIIWLHNGRQLKNRINIAISHKTMALRNVSKYQSGNYTCVASNAEGRGESNNFHLKIIYKPVCKANQTRIYGIDTHELAKVPCQVEAYPPPSHFKWTFNNSAESKDISSLAKLQPFDNFTSVVAYKPIHKLDYGTILCWASNKAGMQMEPCVFRTVPAGKPDQPYNCTILNTSSYTIDIKCIEGFDGGLQQTALLTVYDQVTSVVLANESASFPIISVDNLEPDKLLRIEIYAVNSKGRSESFQLTGHTLMDPAQNSVLSKNEQDRLEIIPILGIMVGFVIMVVILSVAAFIIVKLRLCKLRRSSPVFSVDNSKANLISLKRPNGKDFLEKDENNPDIIPCYTNLQHLSINNSSMQSPQENVSTPLTEAFLAKNREQELYALTYVELAPMKTDSLQHNKFPPKKDKDRVVYAEIEHDKKSLPQPNTFAPGLRLAAENYFPSSRTTNYPESRREVVTTKGPSTGYHQESRV